MKKELITIDKKKFLKILQKHDITNGSAPETVMSFLDQATVEPENTVACCYRHLYLPGEIGKSECLGKHSPAVEPKEQVEVHDYYKVLKTEHIWYQCLARRDGKIVTIEPEPKELDKKMFERSLELLMSKINSQGFKEWVLNGMNFQTELTKEKACVDYHLFDGDYNRKSVCITCGLKLSEPDSQEEYPKKMCSICKVTPPHNSSCPRYKEAESEECEVPEKPPVQWVDNDMNAALEFCFKWGKPKEYYGGIDFAHKDKEECEHRGYYTVDQISHCNNCGYKWATNKKPAQEKSPLDEAWELSNKMNKPKEEWEIPTRLVSGYGNKSDEIMKIGSKVNEILDSLNQLKERLGK